MISTVHCFDAKCIENELFIRINNSIALIIVMLKCFIFHVCEIDAVTVEIGIPKDIDFSMKIHVIKWDKRVHCH